MIGAIKPNIFFEIDLVRNRNFRRTKEGVGVNSELDPRFFIVVRKRQSKKSKEGSTVVEQVGTFTPSENACSIDGDRIIYWLERGVQVNDRIKPILNRSAPVLKNKLHQLVQKGSQDQGDKDQIESQLDKMKSYVDEHATLPNALASVNDFEIKVTFGHISKHESDTEGDKITIYTTYKKSDIKGKRKFPVSHNFIRNVDEVLSYNNMWHPYSNPNENLQIRKAVDVPAKEVKYLSFISKIDDDFVFVKAFSRKNLEKEHEKFILKKEELIKQIQKKPEAGDLLDLTISFERDQSTNFSASLLSNKDDIQELEKRTMANSSLSDILKGFYPR